MKEKTAIEWLVLKLRIKPHALIEVAKELEKQQIIDAFFAGYNYDGGETEEKAEQYYNQTYNL